LVLRDNILWSRDQISLGSEGTAKGFKGVALNPKLRFALKHTSQVAT